MEIQSGAELRDLHRNLMVYIKSKKELRVVLFGGLNNILKGQSVEEIAKEFDSLFEDIKHANPSSWVSWATLPLPPGAVSFKPEEENKPNNRLTYINAIGTSNPVFLS